LEDYHDSESESEEHEAQERRALITSFLHKVLPDTDLMRQQAEAADCPDHVARNCNDAVDRIRSARHGLRLLKLATALVVLLGLPVSIIFYIIIRPIAFVVALLMSFANNCDPVGGIFGWALEDFRPKSAPWLDPSVHALLQYPRWKREKLEGAFLA
jgi:hypothetical protein